MLITWPQALEWSSALVCVCVSTFKHCRCVGVCVKSILSAGFSFFKSVVGFQRKTSGVGVLGGRGIEIKVLIKGGINTMLIKWASGRGSRCCYSIL